MRAKTAYQISEITLECLDEWQHRKKIERLLPTIPKSEYDAYISLKKDYPKLNIHILKNHIEFICLCYKQLESIPQQISQFTHLYSANFAGNTIKKIEYLNQLIKLRDLTLGCNRISKIEELHMLTQLESLMLGANQISKVEGLDKLTRLQHLRLVANKICRIEGLEKNTHLESLSIGNNQISKIEGLENLSNLNYLDLSYNKISKIEGLDNLRKLKEIHLYGNPINWNDESIKKQIRKLEQMGVKFATKRPYEK